jgi:hypothetical protein
LHLKTQKYSEKRFYKVILWDRTIIAATLCDVWREEALAERARRAQGLYGNIKSSFKGWECGSIVECLPSIHEGLIVSAAKRQKKVHLAHLFTICRIIFKESQKGGVSPIFQVGREHADEATFYWL